MNYRDEMVRQRIKQMVEQGGYLQRNHSNIPIYIALVVVGLLVGCALEYIARLS